MIDPRIGTLNPDGSVEEYPAVDVNGREYTRPVAGTHRLDTTHFVVLPFNFSNRVLIEEVKAVLVAELAAANADTPTEEITLDDEAAPEDE
jgi:hypothetical protein